MKSTRKIVLGTVQFGCQYGINSAGRPDSDAVKDILANAWKAGIRTLDTSSAYGNSEEVLGGSISAGADFRIVSKYPKGDKSVAEMLDGSLKRLHREKLYGYLLHHFEVYRKNPSVWDDFMELKDKRLVEKIGFSLYSPEELELLLGNGVEFDLLQFPRNIFDRQFDPYLRELKDRGAEIHVRSTFLQGLFFKDRSALPTKLQPLAKYLLQLDEYAEGAGMSIEELALNFNIQNEFVDGVLTGVDNTGQLMNNVNAISDKEVRIDINVREQELLNPVNWN